MSPGAANNVIRQLRRLDEKIAELRSERAALIASLPDGRIEGTQEAIYIRPAGHDFAVSVKMLAQYVSPALLKQCRVRHERSRTLKWVPKLKPKAPKQPRNQEQM